LSVVKSPHEVIIAHRGESYEAPENTIGAINLAWEKGVRAVEIDIQLTADNEIVVIHDKDTFRVTGHKLIIRRSLLKDLTGLRITTNRGEKWKESIPLLREVLKTVPEGRKLIIEIKSNANILEKLKEELHQSGAKDSQIELISFDAQVIGRAKQMMPYYKMLLLLDLDYYLPWWLVWVNKQTIIRKIRLMNLDGVDVWAGKMLNNQFISAFKNAGLLIYSWTVNDPGAAKKLLNYNIDGITTDRAAWMLNQLSKS